MVGRCRWPSHTSWKWYGARGIKVCKRWLSFENFLADMGPPPFDGATIERKDPNGDYQPENCIWASQVDQGRNRTNNLILELNGKRQAAVQWAEELKIPASRIESRKARGWSDYETLTRPPRQTSLTIQ